MAIAVIKADRRWFITCARAFHDQPRLQRELTRAADRQSLTGSFTAAEARLMAGRRPDDPRLQEAVRAVEVAEISERERSRALHARMDRYRSEGTWRKP